MRVENSFIPIEGVGPETERGLWRCGITHWDDFTGAGDGAPSGIGATRADRIASFIGVARDHLERGDIRFFHEVFPDRSHWRLYDTFRERACFLDIETTGLDAVTNDVTVVTLHQAGETTTLVRDRSLDHSQLRTTLADAGLLVTFNGKRFDIPFLEREFDLSIDLPHLDLMYPCRRVGLTGGLKTIEKEVGIERERSDISGEDAVRLWHEYVRGDDTSALDQLVSYNRSDTVNLATVADEVARRLDDEVTGNDLTVGGTNRPACTD